MKKLSLISLFLFSFSIFGCSRNAGSDNQNNSDTPNFTNQQYVPETPAANSSKAPDFNLVDTQGKNISLSKLAGKVVIIDFWATWCPPCRRGIPDLIDIQKQFKNKVVVVGISVDTDTKSNVVPFIKSMGINYPIVYATQSVVQDYGNIESIPTTFIIDKKGNIANQHVGLTDKSVLIDEIQGLIKKS